MPFDAWLRVRPPGLSSRLSRRLPELIAVIYVLAGFAWIAFSDRVVSLLAADYAGYRVIQTYKGWVFVAASALVILLMLKWTWRGVLAAYAASSESERRLDFFWRVGGQNCFAHCTGCHRNAPADGAD